MAASDDLPDAHSARTPYVSAARYDQPKEDFRAIMRRLEQIVDTAKPLDVVDVGCANGELLYQLHRQWPHWNLTGYDRDPRFLATGRSFPGLADVRLCESDLSDIEGEFDIVIATCFLSLFPEIEPPVEKLLSLCRPGGHVLATGLFNPFDLDVRVQFCDHTEPGTDPVWRTDFNRHSQRRVREHFAPRVESIEFAACTYPEVHIDQDPENPARVWTWNDAAGNTWLINGAWQIANQTLMTIHK